MDANVIRRKAKANESQANESTRMIKVRRLPVPAKSLPPLTQPPCVQDPQSTMMVVLSLAFVMANLPSIATFIRGLPIVQTGLTMVYGCLPLADRRFKVKVNVYIITLTGMIIGLPESLFQTPSNNGSEVLGIGSIPLVGVFYAGTQQAVQLSNFLVSPIAFHIFCMLTFMPFGHMAPLRCSAAGILGASFYPLRTMASSAWGTSPQSPPFLVWRSS